MATESFYEDMVIDTPEAAANLTALFESGVKWKRGDSRIAYADVDDETVRRLFEKYRPEQRWSLIDRDCFTIIGLSSLIDRYGEGWTAEVLSSYESAYDSATESYLRGKLSRWNAETSQGPISRCPHPNRRSSDTSHSASNA